MTDDTQVLGAIFMTGVAIMAAGRVRRDAAARATAGRAGRAAGEADQLDPDEAVTVEVAGRPA